MKNFEDMFVRFDSMYERDRQTLHDGIGSAYAQHRAAKIRRCRHVIQCWRRRGANVAIDSVERRRSAGRLFHISEPETAKLRPRWGAYNSSHCP